jgi:hypothetical protein
VPPATVPLPIWVLKNGMRVRRMNSTRPVAKRGRLDAAPSITSGRCASRIIAAARARAAGGATGSSIGCGGTIAMSAAASPAISSGSSRCTGPGRSSIATRNASRTSVGMVAVLTIWRVDLVSGRIVATMSTIWKRACRLPMIPFWPVIMTIGIAPRCA